jgi:DNA anti-recombination protein RmuC
MRAITNQVILQENSKKEVSLPSKNNLKKKREKKGARIKEQKRKNLIC